jgi:hypothetical protein
MYWRIRDLWGPANLVASTVTELDDTLPYLQDVHRDSVWATHECPSRHRVEDMHYGKVVLARFFDSRRALWPLVGSS